jgi:hypothetical protein
MRAARQYLTREGSSLAIGPAQGPTEDYDADQ